VEEDEVGGELEGGGSGGSARWDHDKPQQADSLPSGASQAAVILPPSAPSLVKMNKSIEEALSELDAILDTVDSSNTKFVPKVDHHMPGSPPAPLPAAKAGILLRLSGLLQPQERNPGQKDGVNGEGQHNDSGQEEGGGGLPESSSDSIGPNPLLGNPQADDTSWPCRLSCRPHGFCTKGICFCTAAWAGSQCEVPRKLPQNLRSNFTGHFILNRRSVLESGGIIVTTNPKASQHIQTGRTHTLFAPFEDVQDRRQDKQYRNNQMNLGKLRPVITRGQLDLLPPEDIMADKIYNTCAIVGNSGLNLVHKDGAEIDAHDAVFRFNSAPTLNSQGGGGGKAIGKPAKLTNFSEHVGSKTSFRFINTQHILFKEGKEWRFQQMQSKNGLFRYLNFKARHPRSHLAGFDSDFTNYVNSNIPTLPTGGYFALMFAIQRCHKVNVYGFHWKPGHAIPHHYFNAEVPLKGKEKIHDYEAEHGNLEALAVASIVELAQPCVAGCPAETTIPCLRCPPGSACACGDNLPMPMSLPGFCHLPKDYKCFYKCPGGAKQCPGGPKASRCPSSMEPHLQKMSCAASEDIPFTVKGSRRPDWMRKGYSARGIKPADMSNFGKVSIGNVRDSSETELQPSHPLANMSCHSDACRRQRKEYQRLAAMAARSKQRLEQEQGNGTASSGSSGNR